MQFFRNWKTSLAGLAAVLTGVAALANGDFTTGGSSLVGGIGLIFARDQGN